MKKSPLFYIICALLMAACSNDDNSATTPFTSSLQGAWTLNNVICFCFFEDDFEFNAHQLTFDTSNNTVTVANGANGNFIISPGVYDFTEDQGVLTIDNNEDLMYSYQIEGDELTLVFVDEINIADDEVTLIYDRN
ncbi:MAG: hypothetical protein AAFZ89_08450 [Bacteroidota bacterium]